MSIPNLLSIAGSDPSGGAGIQADLKTFGALECYGMAAITSLTAQNTQGVDAVEELPPAFIEAQIRAIFEDIRVDAVKIGMIGSAKTASVIARVLEEFAPPFIVLDPVMVASSGDYLVGKDAIQVIKEELLPLASVITPNIPEAEVLLRKSVMDLERSAFELLDLGAGAVFLKGGHMKGAKSIDVLAIGDEAHVFESPRVNTNNTHGTGCTLSSALAAFLAHGMSLAESAQAAKDYVHGAIVSAQELEVGSGHGPLHHMYELWDE